MPWNIQRTAALSDNEFLRSPAGLDDSLSVVIDSTKVAELPASSGMYQLYKGTVMGKINASSKVCAISAGAYGSGSSGAWVAADIVGILANNVKFWIGQGITAGAATDEPAAVLWHGCDFNVSKLLGYTGNETIVKAALFTCRFR